MKKVLTLCLLQFFTIPAPGIAGEVEKQIEQPVKEAISIMQKTQTNEEEWRRIQEKLVFDLESLQLQIEQLTGTRDELQKHVASTQTRIKAKEQQLANIMTIKKDLDPFLEQLVLRLNTLPKSGLPFLTSERTIRIEKLGVILHDPDISISEKYRKIMETLQIETEFGLTIETYQDMIERNDQQVLVNILRLGRLGLYYVNLDESGCGFYNIANSDWQQLPNQYINSLQTAVAIASKRRPAEFINMPLGRMVKK